MSARQILEHSGHHCTGNHGADANDENTVCGPNVVRVTGHLGEWRVGLVVGDRDWITRPFGAFVMVADCDDVNAPREIDEPGVDRRPAIWIATVGVVVGR